MKLKYFLITAMIAVLTTTPAHAAPNTLEVGGFSGGTMRIPVPDSTIPMSESQPVQPNPMQQFESIVSGIPKTLNAWISSATGAFQIPSIDKLIQQIMNGDANATDQTSNVLEHNPQGSLPIRQDLIKTATRGTAIKTATEMTLGQSAQQQLMQRAEQTNTDTQQNVQLGQQSQGSNVSQEILKNVSQQLALTGQVDQRVVQELQQSRVDRAIGNTLTAQMADDLASMNTATRRETISTGTSLSQQASLMMLPGGYTLGSRSSTTRP